MRLLVEPDPEAGVLQALLDCIVAKRISARLVDNKVWQDVYHGEANGIRLYVKLTVVDDVLIVSFMEL